MRNVKVFIKNECSKCPAARDLGKKIEAAGFFVEYFNVDTAEGLSEAMMNQVMATPTIIIEDESETVTGSWRGIVPPEQEVIDALQ